MYETQIDSDKRLGLSGNLSAARHHGVCVSVRAAGRPDRLCGVCVSVRDFESSRGPSCHHGVCVSVRAAGGPHHLCGVCV